MNNSQTTFHVVYYAGYVVVKIDVVCLLPSRNTKYQLIMKNVNIEKIHVYMLILTLHRAEKFFNSLLAY